MEQTKPYIYILLHLEILSRGIGTILYIFINYHI